MERSDKLAWNTSRRITKADRGVLVDSHFTGLFGDCSNPNVKNLSKWFFSCDYFTLFPRKNISSKISDNRSGNIENSSTKIKNENGFFLTFSKYKKYKY